MKHEAGKGEKVEPGDRFRQPCVVVRQATESINGSNSTWNPIISLELMMTRCPSKFPHNWQNFFRCPLCIRIPMRMQLKPTQITFPKAWSLLGGKTHPSKRMLASTMKLTTLLMTGTSLCS